MAHIKVTEGLDIPIEGQPTGDVQQLPKPSMVSCNLSPFFRTKFKLLVKTGDEVKIGQALVFDKDTPERKWVAPAAGIVKEVRRGLKRRLLEIVIEVAENEESVEFGKLDPNSTSREDITTRFLEAGIFTLIRQRPFGRIANPAQAPRAIFVKAIESAPFVPAPEMQVEGFEREFQAGLDALKQLTDGQVHLVYRKGSSFEAFTHAKNVESHTAEGPHPVANASVHIHHIDPIESFAETTWVCNAHDVVCMGDLLLNGRIHNERIIGLGGPAIHEERRGFFRVRTGHPVGDLIAGRNVKGLSRLISGDVLMGEQVTVDDFLKCNHFAFTAIRENTEREMLHFFRLGADKYTYHKTYLSGMVDNSQRTFDMTTNLHGEERGFVEGWVYQEVMPMQVPVMPLVKSLIGGDYDAAEEFGLLEIDPEDFALPTFIDPVKTEMVDIVRQGIIQYASEVLD